MFSTFFFIEVQDETNIVTYGPYTDLSEAIVLMCDYAGDWFLSEHGSSIKPKPMTLTITEQIHTEDGFDFIAERCKETRYDDEDIHG